MSSCMTFDYTEYRRRRRAEGKDQVKYVPRPEYQRNWRADNQEKIKEHGRKQRYRRYGLSFEEGERIRSLPCSICGALPPSQIDHCHATGRVRGSLCRKCNIRLGYWETTGHDWLEAARSYLTSTEHFPLQEEAQNTRKDSE